MGGAIKMLAKMNKMGDTCLCSVYLSLNQDVEAICETLHQLLLERPKVLIMGDLNCRLAGYSNQPIPPQPIHPLPLPSNIQLILNAIHGLQQFKTLVRPMLEFVSPIWMFAPASLTERMEKIQENFFNSYIFHYYPFDLKYEELLCGCKIDELSSRRKLSSSMFVVNIVSGKLLSPLCWSWCILIPLVSLHFEITYMPLF